MMNEQSESSLDPARPRGSLALDAERLLDSLDGVAYLTDAEGVVVAIGRTAWNSFAAATGGVCVRAESMPGRSIFDAMQGPVIDIYRRLHARLVSGERASVTFEYRCDAPDLRRDMRMSISVLRASETRLLLLHQSQMIACAPRPWVRLLEPERILRHFQAQSHLPIVKLCAFCQKVAWTSGPRHEWIEPEDYYRRGGAIDVRTSHGVCPPCQTQL